MAYNDIYELYALILKYNCPVTKVERHKGRITIWLGDFGREYAHKFVLEERLNGG